MRKPFENCIFGNGIEVNCWVIAVVAVAIFSYVSSRKFPLLLEAKKNTHAQF